LRSIQTLPAEADGEFLRVAVRVQFTASLESIHHILYTLETNRPFVFLDNLDVRNRRVRRRKELENTDPDLTIRFDLAGYLRPEGGS
jgi:general secretion pathway protein M